MSDGSGRTAIVAALVGSLWLSGPGPSHADPLPPQGVSRPHTIGLTLTSWRYAFVETPEASECAGGLQPGEIAQLKATPGAIERIKAEGGSFENRGPNGETPQHSPEVVKDPLPFHETITKTGFGMNLDGTEDGRATARTCRHEKFVNAAGEKVDNQSARVLGCVLGFRTGGQTAEFYSNEIANYPVNRHLIEVTGVDSEVNDPAVIVRFYKGYDRLVRTADGKFVTMLSQRIDTRYPEYQMTVSGRIADGVLITEPIPVALFPHSSEQQYATREMRDMRLRLKLTPDGGEGMLAGYDDWQRQAELHSKRVTASIDRMSLPSLWQKFRQYADGYPDPKTGQCRFISATYKVTAVRAIIVHPDHAERAARN